MREWEKKRDLPTGSLSKHLSNSWSWARPKLGAQSSIWVSHRGAGAQTLGLSSIAFPGILAGNQIRSGAVGVKADIQMLAAGITSGSFTHAVQLCCPINVLKILVFKLVMWHIINSNMMKESRMNFKACTKTIPQGCQFVPCLLLI